MSSLLYVLRSAYIKLLIIMLLKV